jgi:hypothetical protein
MKRTMLRLKRAQRAMLVDKLPDTANLALGALTFGQFLASSLSLIVLAMGAALWVLLMGFATYLASD